MTRTFLHKWHDHDSAYINSEYGFCKVNIYPRDKVAELYDLIVYPEHRHQGYGKDLLVAAIAAARQHDCDVIVLWPDCEEWTKNWYGRNGFEPNPAYINHDFEVGWAKKL